MSKMNQDEQKKLVAKTAVDALLEKGLIFDGMKIGMGTGSTALPAVKRISELLANGTLKNIKAVATSYQTENACAAWKIPTYAFYDIKINGHLDLAIDGADEIDDNNNLIKGGGAALLREKIIEYNSAKVVIVADSSKPVKTLGTKFPLPVEIVPDAYAAIKRELEKLGATVTLREGVRKYGPVITDNGNQIVDCLWKEPVNPIEFENLINQITGVVENGFFTRANPSVFIAKEDGTVEIRNF